MCLLSSLIPANYFNLLKLGSLVMFTLLFCNHRTVWMTMDHCFFCIVVLKKKNLTRPNYLGKLFETPTPLSASSVRMRCTSSMRSFTWKIEATPRTPHWNEEVISLLCFWLRYYESFENPSQQEEDSKSLFVTCPHLQLPCRKVSHLGGECSHLRFNLQVYPWNWRSCGTNNRAISKETCWEKNGKLLYFGMKTFITYIFLHRFAGQTLLKRPMEDLDFAVPRKRFCELWWDNKTSGCDVQELVRLQLYLRISLRQGKVCYAKMSVFAAHSMIRPWSPSNAPWKRDAGLTCHAPGCCILILFALNETSG